MHVNIWNTLQPFSQHFNRFFFSSCQKQGQYFHMHIEVAGTQESSKVTQRFWKNLSKTGHVLSPLPHRLCIKQITQIIKDWPPSSFLQHSTEFGKHTWSSDTIFAWTGSGVVAHARFPQGTAAQCPIGRGNTWSCPHLPALPTCKRTHTPLWPLLCCRVTWSERDQLSVISSSRC